ncbi:MAG: branched-chain amino acid ABC transporter permease [Candidatus Heteroscillospira sp.]|jgi:branched-chain amino acid transport system permease protein
MTAFVKKHYALALLILAVIVPLFISSSYIMVVLNTAISYSICALGVYVVLGLTGQMSQAQAAFFAAGAYGSAYFSSTMGLPVWLTIFIGVGISALAGLVIGVPTLKLSGRYLTITTLGFTIIVKLILDNWNSVTKGSDGMRGIPTLNLFGFDFSSKHSMFYFALFMLVVSMLFVRRLRDGEFGMALKMVRDNDDAAQACGINIAFYKTVAFVIGGMLGGLGGTVYAHTICYIQPADFAVTMSQNILIMVVVGGYKWMAGAVIGGIVITILPEVLRFMSDYRILFYGIMVCLVIAFMPGGICEGLMRINDFVGKKLNLHKEADVNADS